ncbi:MAG: hypothetical protein QF415_01525 [Candidatus Undinarchaeales archaeon]|jgi:hypothetical protein|nr:hypothetical protein [Candidatus Undinarchaeales archaeon]MDP7493386.1 hypothetical protein [Candidatus Undinarchaeales archaeon]
MIELPWYLENHRAFLVPPLVLALLIATIVLGDLLGPGIKEQAETALANKPLGLMLAISTGLSVWALAEYGHLAAVVKELGPRVVDVELVAYLRSATVRVTTLDGRSFTMLYDASYKGIGYHYAVWVATEAKVSPAEREKATEGIRHLYDLRVLTPEDGKPRRMSARISDDGNFTVSDDVTQNVVKAIDMLYELTR